MKSQNKKKKNLCDVRGCKREVRSYGFCAKHWDMMRYYNDKEFNKRRKKQGKERMLRYYYKKTSEDPEWNARRQKEFRRKHPKGFNYCMARYYFRKLTALQRERLLQEMRTRTRRQIK